MKVLAICVAVMIIGAWSQTTNTTTPRSGCYSSEEFNSTLGKCQSCPSNCTRCTFNIASSVDTCSSCTSGAYVLTSAGADRYGCSKCADNCNYCKGPAAADCMDWTYDYKFNSQLGQVFKCTTTNCLVCSAENMCQKCKTNYFLDATSKTCTYCGVSGCAECNKTGTCTKCVGGNFLTATGLCTSCTTGCSSCDATGTCSKCVDGYFLNAATKVCDRCSDSFCTKCSTGVAKCDTCTARYYLGSNGNCTKCADYCQTCTGSGDTCTACDAALTNGSAITLNTGKCTVCTTAGCAKCDGTGKCLQAMPGFWLNADSTVTQCSSNCANCSSNTTCTACTPDSMYSVRPDGKCDWSSGQYRASYWTNPNTTSIDYSKAFTSDWNCQYAYGFNFTGNDSSRNTNATCTKCEDGYYLDKMDWKCKQCTPGCSTCQMLNGYVTCLTKNTFNGAWTWYNGTWNKTKSWAGDMAGPYVCPMNCKTCVPTQIPTLGKDCTECMPGYYLVVSASTGDKKCISNTLPCEQYAGDDKTCWTGSMSASMLAFNAIILAVLGFLFL